MFKTKEDFVESTFDLAVLVNEGGVDIFSDPIYTVYYIKCYTLNCRL